MVFDSKEFICNKIKLARKNANITQEQLAEKIGISSKQISRIESMSYIPSVPTFLKIIDVLNINISEFGINELKHNNTDLEEFIKIIYSLDNRKLKFCLETVKTMIKNFYN